MSVRFTSDGESLSPPLIWAGAPSATREYAVTCEDPEMPECPFVHWTIYGIPAMYDHIDEGVPPVSRLENGTTQGTNSFGRTGWGGPEPPIGKPHRYVFTLYALDAELGLRPGLTKDQLLQAIESHVVGKGSLTALYGR